MSFCKFSTQFLAKSYTIIDNLFFTQYLTTTPPKDCSIYLYGLFLCEQNEELTLRNFAQDLGFSENEITESFRFWEEQGIISIVSESPFEVQYLPLKHSSNTKLYNKDKYAKFNVDAQNILTDRQITPNEYQAYYDLMEGYSLSDGRKITPEALLMIICYCAKNKGANINYKYIITVARDWASEGCVTPQQIEEKLTQYSESTQTITKILKALGSTKKPSIDEHQLYLKWKNDLYFNDECILYVAKAIKKGARPNFEKLDKKLLKYYELHLTSIKEIGEYEKNLDEIYSLAREMNKILGIYYEDVTNEVETYITPWLNLGYTRETLTQVAQNNFLNGKRNLNNLNETISDLHQKGIISIKSYTQYLSSKNQIKEEIAKMLNTLGIIRNVTSIDIEFWQRWTVLWGFDKEIIDYAISLSKDKGGNISYLNTILADWHLQNIYTLEQAKLSSENFKQTKKVQNSTKVNSRTYSNEENEKIFDKFKTMDI